MGKKGVDRVGKHVMTQWSRLTMMIVVGVLSVLLLAGGGVAVVMAQTSPDDDPTAAPVAGSASPTPTETTPAGDEDGERAEPADTKTLKSDKKSDSMRALVEARAEALAKARARAERLVKRRNAAPPPATFRLTSFNVLGSSHTSGGGNKPGYAAGSTRMGWAVGLLRSQGIDVAGLQEYEPSQHSTFMRLAGGGWGVYPGGALGNNAMRNSIAWDLSTWEAVRTETIQIPYFRGKMVPMPYVLLEHKETGRQIWFINIHNPTSNSKRGNNQYWRNVGTAREANLMSSLAASGTPVILMGDFNERGEAFCRVTAGGRAHAANGGTASPCRLPAGAGIDWIFGSLNVDFSGYVRYRSSTVARTSDHPMVMTTVTLDGPVED